MMRPLGFALALALVAAACEHAKVVAPVALDCDTSVLRGTYGSQRNGQTGPGASFTSVGLAVFDGQGTLVEQQTVSRSGVFSTGASERSTYSIDSDCTGTESDANGNAVARLVMVHGGDEVLGMSVLPGNNVAVHFERITGACSLSTLKGQYGFQRNGQAGPGLPLLAIGSSMFDGAGNQLVFQQSVRNGVVGTVNRLVGTYQVNTDCTGSQTDTTGLVFARLVVVNGGDEVLGMSLTPPNNVVVHYERVKQ